MKNVKCIAATLNKLRLSGFRIPKANHTVKNVINGCYLCKKMNAFSFRYPKVTNSYNIKHLTILLYSAWVGSTWKRLIRKIKSCLYKIYWRFKINYFDLLNTLLDIQNSVNARPLTYALDQFGDYYIQQFSSS